MNLDNLFSFSKTKCIFYSNANACLNGEKIIIFKDKTAFK